MPIVCLHPNGKINPNILKYGSSLLINNDIGLHISVKFQKDIVNVCQYIPALGDSKFRD